MRLCQSILITLLNMKGASLGASLLWRMSKSATYQQNNATFDTDAPLKFFSLRYKNILG